MRGHSGPMIAATSPEPMAAPRAQMLLLVPAAAALLMWATLFNGFPLVFPDSGTYLGIALGREYAIDRSSAYGFFLKPFVTALPGVGGLWLGIAAQALAVAAVLVLTARHMNPALSNARLLGCIAAAAMLTSLAWHAGQFMPDAFTGPLLLLAWLAASRDPGESGAPLLWLAAAAVALTHYTHLVLLVVAAGTAIVACAAMGASVRTCTRRLVAALIAAASVAATLTVTNAAVLSRPSVSPAGPLFLFARLNEDGLVPAWLDRHCGRDAPAELCGVRAALPRDSQTLLWGGAATPLTGLIWHAKSEGDRWRWMTMMATANRGAVAEQPAAFLASAARGTLRQLVTFRALDDECPVGCRDPSGGIAFTLNRYRPVTITALRASRQVRDSTGRSLIRAVTTPIAALALLLLPFATAMAWRRCDAGAFALLAVVTTGLLVNAALAGALSDVHDRYQSRVVWLAPFTLLLLALRWRSGARSVQTLSRSRISLPGLK